MVRGAGTAGTICLHVRTPYLQLIFVNVGLVVRVKLYTTGMEGILFYQQFGEHWEQTYAVAENGSFTAFNRIREDIPSSLSNRGDSIKEFRIITGSVSAKSVKMGLAALSKIKRGNKGLPGHLYFFSATVYDADKGDETLNMATLTEEDRAGWLSLFKASMGKPVDSHGKSSRRNKNSSRDDRDQSQNETMDSIQMQHLSHSPGSIAGEKNHNQSQNQTPWKERKEDQRDRNSSLFSPVGIVSPPAGRRINAPRMQSNVNFHSTLEHAQDQTENEKEQVRNYYLYIYYGFISISSLSQSILDEALNSSNILLSNPTYHWHRTTPSY